MITKNRFGLILGFVAFALATIPTFASANVLTDPTGTVPAETEVRATSTNFVTKTAVGEFDCEHIEVGGEVTANSGETIAIGMLAESEEIAEHCVRRTPIGEEAFLVTPTFQGLHLTTGGTNSASYAFLMHFPGLGLTCNFEGTVTASAVEEGAGLQAEGAISGTSPEPCPAGGNFSATFSLNDPNGTVTFD